MRRSPDSSERMRAICSESDRPMDTWHFTYVGPACLLCLSDDAIDEMRSAMDELSSRVADMSNGEQKLQVIHALGDQVWQLSVYCRVPLATCELEFIVEFARAIMKTIYLGSVRNSEYIERLLKLLLQAMEEMSHRVWYLSSDSHECLLEAGIWFAKLTNYVPDFLNELAVQEMLVVDTVGVRRQRLTWILFLLEVFECGDGQFLPRIDRTIRQAYMHLVESIHLETEYELLFYFY